MSTAFGAFVILFVISALLLVSLKPSLAKKTFWANLTNYATCDRIFRVVQYYALICSATLGRQSPCQPQNYSILLSALHRTRFQNLTLLMSRSRKITRFIRAPLLFLSIKNRSLPLNFSNKAQTLCSVETLARLSADISDMVFFLTDHYGVFYWLGLTGQASTVKNLTTLGDVMWICNAFSGLVRQGCQIWRFWLKMGNKKGLLSQKQVKLALMECFSLCNEVILGFSFLNPDLLTKETIGVIALASTINRLCKFGVN